MLIFLIIGSSLGGAFDLILHVFNLTWSSLSLMITNIIGGIYAPHVIVIR
jgi:hypothetical protein